jgi:Domain of unknown function (DUF4198)
MARGRSVFVLVALSAAALLAPPPVGAHDLWIAPSSFTPALGEPIRLHLVLGSGEVEEAVPRSSASIVRFVAIGPDGRLDVPGMDGLDPAGFLRPAAPGWYTILYESSPSFTTLGPDTFRAYVLEKGLERPAQAQAAALDRPSTELFRRSLKARVLVAAPGVPAPPQPPEGEQPAGLPLELLLERVEGGEVALRLLLDGAPLADTQVDVRRLDHREIAFTARTGADGRLRVSLEPGSWLATAVHLDGSNPATADWESVWTSLTFELR